MLTILFTILFIMAVVYLGDLVRLMKKNNNLQKQVFEELKYYNERRDRD